MIAFDTASFILTKVVTHIIRCFQQFDDRSLLKRAWNDALLSPEPIS